MNKTPNKTPNKTIGAIFIVAGTTIGGGMIGMPITSAHVGLKYSIFVMLLIWAFMLATSLITLEMNLYFKKGVSISYAAEKFLNKGGKILSTLTIGFLSYALLAAYMTGSAAILCESLGLQSGNKFIIIGLALILGGIICTRVKTVDLINRFLVIIMLGCFVFLIWYLIPSIDPKLLTIEPKNWIIDLPLLVPLFFTSFAFHGSIPTLVNYIGPDRAKLRFIFFAGLSIPLIIYIIWETICLGSIPGEKIGGNLDGLVSQLSKIIPPMFIQGFSLCAILTSFLGVGIGLFDFMKENTKLSSKSYLGAITFIPPLLFALFYPQGFITALCYAAIALSLLAVIIPSFIVLKMNIKTIPKFALILSILIGILIICLDIYHMTSSFKIPQKESVKVVEVESVIRQDLYSTTTLLGTVQAKKFVFLTSKSIGILSHAVAPGTALKKGDVIAKLENKDATKALELVTQTEKIAKAQHDRMNILAKANVVNKQSLEDIKNQWISAQKNLLQAKSDLEKTQFIAPFDGIVGNYKMREGSQVQNSDAVVSFYDPSEMVVEFDIPAHILGKLQPNLEIIVKDKKYPLKTIPKMIDADTYMAPAYCDINGSDCFIGEIVDVSVPIQSSLNTLTLKEAAVFLKDGQTYVYKIKDEKTELIKVKTGFVEKEKIEIKEGLIEGDQIVIYGQDRLHPGLKVEISPK